MVPDFHNATTRAYFYTLGVVITLYFGWSQRDSNYLHAEDGAGYILGIVGASCMIILLLYSLSKRVSILTRFMPLRYWFGIHMFLGTVGPILILFHSNFRMGSVNSSVALFSMLLVAGSGVLGRYIYVHIHHGLYGASLTLKELQQKTAEDHSELVSLYAKDEKLNNQLQHIEKKALKQYSNLIESLIHVIYLSLSTPGLKRKILRLVKNSYLDNTENRALPDSKVVTQLISHYIKALKQAAAFRVYERLFSLWHIFHLPLFFMMLITAIIHIFAVHLY